MLTDNLAEFQLWTGERIRQVVRNLDDDKFMVDVEGSSVQSLCTHIVHALEYCFIIQDNGDVSEMFARVAGYSKEQLLDRWHELDLALYNLIKSNPEGRVTVSHVSDWPFTIDIIDFAVQYVFHTTHHRGQLVRILRILDQDIPGTDYLFYLAEIYARK